MHCELTTLEDGIAEYYRFNQGVAGENNSTETTLADSAGGNTDGVLHGFTLNGSTSNWIAPGGVVSGNSCPPPPAGAALDFDGPTST